jgi:hypothetical protein
MRDIELELTIWASGHYLCEELPEDFMSLEDEEVYEFCKLNAWEPFEYYSGEQIYGFISSLATSAEWNIPDIMRGEYD